MGPHITHGRRKFSFEYCKEIDVEGEDVDWLLVDDVYLCKLTDV